jgi:hypothetical protein
MKKLLAALADDTKTESLVGLAFDFTLEQPVQTFIEPELLLAHVDRALTEALTEAAIARHVRPFLEREQARAEARGDRVGDWLPAQAKETLRGLAGRPVRLERAFLEGLVEQEAVKHLVRSVVEETLDRFLQTLKPGGSGGGVLGAMGRGAVGFASGLGKGLLGGLGAQMEQQLKAAASAFIAGSMNVVMERVVTLLASPDTGVKLGRMNQTGFDEALKQKTGRVWAQAMKLPVDALLGVVPSIITHNLSRPEIRAGILDEVRAFIEVEGARTLREILAEAGAVDAWREETIAKAAPLLRTFAASEPFRAWVAAR